MQQFTPESTSRRGAEAVLRRVARDIVVFHDVTGQFCCQGGSLPTQVVLASLRCAVAPGRLPRSTACQILGFLHAGVCESGSAARTWLLVANSKREAARTLRLAAACSRDPSLGQLARCMHWSLTFHHSRCVGRHSSQRSSHVLTLDPWSAHAGAEVNMRQDFECLLMLGTKPWTCIGCKCSSTSLTPTWYDSTRRCIVMAFKESFLGLLRIAKRVTTPLCSSIVAAPGAQLARSSCATSSKTAGFKYYSVF